MEQFDRQDPELWQGGPWEHPGTPAEPLKGLTPAETRRRPVLRTRKAKKPRPWLYFLGGAALVAVLTVAIAWGRNMTMPYYSPFPFENMPDFSYGYEDYYQEESTDPPAIPQAATGTGVTVELMADTGIPLTYREIYDKNAPSLVSIQCYDGAGASTGTGIVLTQDGYLLTNAHVVAGADRVQVVSFTNAVYEASLVGFDAAEDLAVLKIEASGLTPVQFGNSDNLHCGDPVAAIGDSLGYRSTITDGIVSALDRELDMDGTTMVLIQTSAAINFGNSGGALINQYGQVVGITTIKIVAYDGSAEGLGFAIPSTRVKYVAETLIAGEEVRLGVFGITVSTLPLEGGGLEVLEVDPASDAYTKGIQAGDTLTTADGQPLTTAADLSRVKQGRGVGDTVPLTWTRNGEEFAAEVALVDPDLVNQDQG